ncbi:putative serine/threonine-protein kinase [Sesbania bispinosa]|nr:putative serine/threonine-protein kinase [Sesbania bispinosa]
MELVLGYKRSAMFEVDAKTARRLRSYGAVNSDNASSTALWSDDRQSVGNVINTKNYELF